MNQHIARATITLPFWFPMLACATLIDLMFFPYYRQLGCDPAEQISKVAWKVMGV